MAEVVYTVTNDSSTAQLVGSGDSRVTLFKTGDKTRIPASELTKEDIDRITAGDLSSSPAAPAAGQTSDAAALAELNRHGVLVEILSGPAQSPTVHSMPFTASSLESALYFPTAGGSIAQESLGAITVDEDSEGLTTVEFTNDHTANDVILLFRP